MACADIHRPDALSFHLLEDCELVSVANLTRQNWLAVLR